MVNIKEKRAKVDIRKNKVGRLGKRWQKRERKRKENWLCE